MSSPRAQPPTTTAVIAYGGVLLGATLLSVTASMVRNFYAFHPFHSDALVLPATTLSLVRADAAGIGVLAASCGVAALSIRRGAPFVLQGRFLLGWALAVLLGVALADVLGFAGAALLAVPFGVSVRSASWYIVRAPDLAVAPLIGLVEAVLLLPLLLFGTAVLVRRKTRLPATLALTWAALLAFSTVIGTAWKLAVE